MNPPDLNGCVILLTGATGGLGRAIADRVWQHGASLLLLARDRDALGALAAELGTTARPDQHVRTRACDHRRLTLGTTHRCDQHVRTRACDLSHADAVPIAIEWARTHAPRLDALINNAAALGPIGPITDNDWSAWEQTIRINLLAPAQLCREAARWMTDAGGGSIVNLSGGGATGPRPNFTAYATAKAGLVRLTETLAHELHASNVRVNAVAPGALNTAMATAVRDAGPAAAGQREFDTAEKLRDQDAPASFGRAVDLIAWLASPASAPVTGRLISAVWDPWDRLLAHWAELDATDIYTLRRITPKERGMEL
jgi:NAD(P)-dependent dehydrogenase (short-subunit alcohol dehydrogenase family)